MKLINRSALLSLALAASLAQAAEKEVPKADLAAGQAMSAACAGCHGPDGNSPAPIYPKLAGQGAAYLEKQIKNFKIGADGKAERTNQLMNPMAMLLPDDAAVRNVAAYFASQKQSPGTAKEGKNDLGRRLWLAGDKSKGLPACSGCHGPAGNGLPAQFPRLAGQWGDYMEAQLKAFRAGERTNDPAKMMRQIALKMTDAEIKAVVDYAVALR